VTRIGNRSFSWGERTYLMGILNITPDSFSDGGKYNDLTNVLIQARLQVDSGADILDIGGQSTRPNAQQISLEEELDRVVPAIRAIRAQLDIPISVDTTRAQVAQSALEAGANMINDISAGTYDSNMFSLVAQWEIPIVLMHIRGNPQTMSQLTDYQDLEKEIKAFLLGRSHVALETGIKPENLILDPGIGFAKKSQQNIELIKEIQSFKTIGYPLLVGLSRKSFIGEILQQRDPLKREWGTAAACSAAIAYRADILRVHNVEAIFEVAKVADAIWREK